MSGSILKNSSNCHSNQGLKELEYQRVARYVNGLKFQIQDEMSTHYFQTMDEAYQIALKVEEKLNRKW
jgi:hypothetical protein